MGPKYHFCMLIRPSNEPKKKKIQRGIFEKMRFLGFYLIKLYQELEAKLLNKVPFKVTEKTYTPNFYLLYTRFKKKKCSYFLNMFPHFIRNGEEPDSIVNPYLYYKIRFFCIPDEVRGHSQKTTTLFFLKWVWRR